MLAAALLASLTWEALFPDGRDQEIIGVLPVRPYVFAASRLVAATFVGLVFAAAVNLPAAAMYSVFSSGHRIFGWNIHGLFLGHAVATMAASFTVFFTLLIIRGAVGIAFGAGAGKWAGALLQLISVVALFETFFFLPGILSTLSMAMLRGDPALILFPPAWFASMHAWLAGHANALLQAAMLRGLMAFLIATAVVVPIYLLPAKWLAARALEKRSRERAAATTFLVHRVSAASRATPATRSVFLFAVASLVGSRRHHLVLASYAGIALGVCLALYFFVEERGSAKIDRPASWMLTMPLLFLFFGLAGLRASFRIPTEAEANWPFRLVPPSLSACVNGTILAMSAMGVLPVALLTAAILLLNWTFVNAVVAVLLQITAGLLLIEVLLLKWRNVPFTCAHTPSPDVLKASWPLYACAIYIYAFGLADWHVAALHSWRALASYLAFAGGLLFTVRLLRNRDMKRHVLEFDVASGGAAELKLSEAVN